MAGCCLTRVAEVLAETVKGRQAEAVARSITDPDRQGNALTEVAVTLAQVGEEHSASRIVAELCVVRRWSTTARPVILLDPSAGAKLICAWEET